MPVGRATISGSPYLGVYIRTGESVAVVPPSAPANLRRELERLLSVKVFTGTVSESELLGALLAFNSHGVIVGDRLDKVERARLESVGPVSEIRVRQNALGNNVLANDRGALVHPEFSEEAIRQVREGLKVPVQRGTVAGLGTVGMAAVATNKGVVVHPRTTEAETKVITEALGAPVHKSTANFGVSVVGACLVANSRGFVAGTPTTSVEIVHLQEGFQVFD
ncbi:MAG TPA: translation initiation factor IF-6 [Thermoplasmata archaeon]|nr:translation initiation factor IF-6 [Thermoplasmata archaeon]